MTPQQEHTVAATLDRAREIIEQHLPSWEGGFAVQVVECVEALKADLAIKANQFDKCLLEITGLESAYAEAVNFPLSNMEISTGLVVDMCEEIYRLRDRIAELEKTVTDCIASETDLTSRLVVAKAKVPEARNIIEVKRTGDQTVSVSFASCRTASVFEKFILSAQEG